VKILFVLEYYYPNIGGVEMLFKTLAESLVKKGNDVQVITMRFKPDLQKEETINGVKVKRLNFRNRVAFALFSVFYVIKEAKSCDLIQTTSSSGGFPAVIAGKLSNKKVVITFHELWGNLWFSLPRMNTFSRWFNYLAEQIIARLPYHRIIPVSDFTRKCLIEAKIPSEKLIRIYNGLDYTAFTNYKVDLPANFTFTFFGRPGVSKGLDILFPAAKKFLSENSDSRLKLIIPTIPAKSYNYVTRQIKKLAIDSQTIILSNLTKGELYDQLCSSSCVVIPSYSEGFCFAATEAIALGVPVISSDKGALKETVSGKNIKLLSLEVDDLYKALKQAKNDNWEFSEIRQFYLEKTVSSYIDLYSEITG